MSEMCSQHQESRNDIQKLYDIVHGKDGYSERIARMEQAQDHMNCTLKEFSTNLKDTKLELKTEISNSLKFWGSVLSIIYIAIGLLIKFG